MRSYRGWVAVGLVVVVALVVAACGGSSSSDSSTSGSSTAASSGQPIKIGVLSGITGDAATVGVPYVNGARMAAEELNARGGVDGRKVELDIADNRTEPVAGVQAGLKLAESDKVDTIVCSCFSTIFFPLTKALARDDILLTNDAASTPLVRDQPGTFITTIPTDDVLAAELSRFAYDLGARTAAMLTVNDPYGLAFRPAANKAFEAAGGRIVQDITVASGLPSYAPEMQRIIDANPDAILAGTYTDDLLLQYKQLVAAGWRNKLFKLYPSSTPLNRDAGAEGRVFGLEGTWMTSPANAAWQESYKREFGEDPSYWSAVGYDAVMLNAIAIAATSSDSASDIRDAMVEAARTYDGPTGRLEFDDTFVRVRAPLARYVVKGGEYVQVDETGKPLADR